MQIRSVHAVFALAIDHANLDSSGCRVEFDLFDASARFALDMHLGAVPRLDVDGTGNILNGDQPIRRHCQRLVYVFTAHRGTRHRQGEYAKQGGQGPGQA